MAPSSGCLEKHTREKSEFTQVIEKRREVTRAKTKVRLVFSASVVSVRRALLVSHDPELFVRLG